MTVKAYDILYSLKDITINYGMIVSGETIMPYSGEWISDVITRIEYLINLTRRDNGILGSEIKIINQVPDFELEYTLIEEKSAWDVLQDIAELCCAYVYVNRKGEIVIEQDNFANRAKPDSGVTVDMGNAFTYSLPVGSKNVVNKVEIEYYDLVPSDEKDDYNIKVNDLEVGTDGKIYFIVKLKKLYRQIQNITSFHSFTIFKTSCGSITFVLNSNQIPTSDFDITIVKANNSDSWKIEKKTYIDIKPDSIIKYGLKEFKGGGMASMTKGIAKSNADKIFAKYTNGIGYLTSNWMGNDELELSTTFMGDIEEDKKRKTFECLSNEMVLGKEFRATTKGIEIE